MPDSTPAQQTPSAPTGATGEAKASLSADEVAKLINNPYMLLGKRFLHTPPPDEDQEYKGMWELESYSARMHDGEADEEFLVLLEDMHGALLPMGREEVEFMLTYSTYA
ncbi:hypothetical protein GY45DRAFT_1320307 [Cubamyces sp. BRFM 1775]|nr:hypothetical protein GY45DRAFT_1320307 [Cubamyces sp. BRFM 1775]